MLKIRNKLQFLTPISVESGIGLTGITDRPKPEADWTLWQCGNCHEAFFLRMRGILKIFSENLRLF
jgi:hypothetical protein